MAFANSIDELNAREAENNGTPVETPATEIAVETPAGGAETVVTPPATETSESKPEEISWLEDFNKTFKTQYKAKDEVETLLSKARMADELEPKVKQIPEFEKREKEYKEQLEKAQRSLNPLSYFSSPDAYKAEALKIQFPDKNHSVLQDVITSDLAKMDNVEVLTKGLMLTEKDLTYEDARGVIQKRYGIEGEDPEEWSSVLKAELKIDSNKVRREFEALKGSVNIPEALTDEQIQTQVAEAKAKREADFAPNIEAFSKFDKFTSKLSDDYTLEFDVPDDFKATLPDMFKGYFVDGGIEYNEENLKDCEDIRNAMLIYRNLPRVYAAIEDDIKVKMTKQTDAKLGNEVPPASQTNVETENKLPGLHEFVSRNK